MVTNSNNAISLVRNEINKVWKELKKTSTKEDLNKLRDEIKKTRNEFTNNLKKYATKEDLDNRIQNSVKELIDFIQVINDQTKKELKQEMQDMKKELKGEIKGVKNDIVQFKDDILSEIIKLREDITIVVGYRDLIEDHEVRIKKLEKLPANN